MTHPGVAGVEEHGDGRDVEDREHHGGDLHTEEGGGDHQLRSARHEPEAQQLERSHLFEVIIIKCEPWLVGDHLLYSEYPCDSVCFCCECTVNERY